MEHFRDGELLAFLAALTDRQATVLVHLLGCARCRKVALPLVRQMAQAASGVGAVAPAPVLAGVWPRVVKQWSANAGAIAADRAAARPLVEELLDRPPGERSPAARGEGRYHTVAVVLTLLERATRAAEREPQVAEELARLALVVIQRLPQEATLRDLQSEAWTLVSHALQLRGDVASAERALRTASHLLEEQDSYSAAALARRLAALRRSGKRPPEALALYQRAVTLFEECGEVTQESAALEEQAMLYAELGDLERAVALLSRAFMLTSRVADAPTALAGRLMLAQLLLRFDRADQAAAVLAQADLGGVDDPALEAMVGVTRAQAAALGGLAQKAERLLSATFEAALDAEARAAAAVVAIQLASLWIWQGRGRELVDFALRLTPLLGGRELPVRVRSALRRLRDAAAAGTADRALIGEVWRATVAGLPTGSLRAGLLMLTGQVLQAGPPEKKESS